MKLIAEISEKVIYNGETSHAGNDNITYNLMIKNLQKNKCYEVCKSGRFGYITYYQFKDSIYWYPVKSFYCSSDSEYMSKMYGLK